MKRARIFLASPFAFAFAACAAFAQQPAPAAASAGVIPTMNCEKPGDSAGIDPTHAQVVRFQKKVDAYKDCVNDYVKAMGAKANEYSALAKTYIDAGNGAIQNYNAYVNALNAQSGGADSTGSVPQAPAAVGKPKY